jgi:uridylate kinase
MSKEIVVLKVGGSILSPTEDNLFDVSTAETIKNKLNALTDNYKFILNCGGGFLARRYQGIAMNLGKSNREIDWIGLEACNMNAVMMRVILGDLAEDVSITGAAVEDATPIVMNKDFLCVGAASPGHSSDFDTMLSAKRTGAKRIFSLKNIDGVYSDDPRKNPDTIKYEKLSWEEYRKDILGTDEFTPKMAVPVDPVTSKMAEEAGIKFIVLDGTDLDNLIKAIKGEEFVGTTIG